MKTKFRGYRNKKFSTEYAQIYWVWLYHWLTSFYISSRRLSLAVAIVTRAVLPTVFNIYYSLLRNHQTLVDNLCNNVLPSIVAFIVNTISSSIHSSRQEISFLTQEERREIQNEITIETNEQGAERSVELSILYEPEVSRNNFVHRNKVRLG